jgi:hypothetical protein
VLGWWVKRNAHAVIAALRKSPKLDDRNLARELDRLMTEFCGEDY